MAVQGKVWSRVMFGGVSLCWEESQVLPLKPFSATEERPCWAGGVVGVVSVGAAWGEEPQNKQAGNPASNWAFLKGEILKQFSRNRLFLLSGVRTRCQTDGAKDVTAR